MQVLSLAISMNHVFVHFLFSVVFALTQFFIAVAILLGVLEKTFFVAEYAVVNTGVSCEWKGWGCGGRKGGWWEGASE